jgi:hypothetical protein
VLGDFPLNPILPAADGARAANFSVTGIEGLIEELERRGVDLLVPEPSSFRGVGGEVSGFVTDYGPVKSAMFRDSEGDVLAINEIGEL